MLNHCSIWFIKATMCWQEVADKAGMKRQPVLSLLAMMDTRIIEHKEDASDRGWKLLVQLGEQSDELNLPLAHERLGRDLACPGIKSCKQVQGTSAFVLMLHTGRQFWERRKRRSKAGARLQIGFFIETQDPLPVCERAGVEIYQKLDLSSKVLVTRHIWRDPQVRAPRSELMGLQNLPNGLEGNGGDNAIILQLASQLGAIPLREGTSKLIRSFTGQFDDIESYLGRKHWGTTRTSLFTQPSYAQLAKASGPFSQMEFAQANLPGCGRVALPQVPSSRRARARLTRPEGMLGQRNQLWICTRVWSLIVIWIFERGPGMFTSWSI